MKQITLLLVLLLNVAGTLFADWVPVEPDKPVQRSVYYSEKVGADQVYVAGNSGFLYRKQGDTWEKIQTYTSENFESIWSLHPDCIYVGGSKGTLLHWNGNVWSPVDFGDKGAVWDIWGSSESDIYILSNGLHHWNGTIWEKIPGISGYCIWGTSADDVFIGKVSLVWHFDGSTWTEMPFPGSVSPAAFDGNAHDDVYAVGREGTFAHFNGEYWSLINSGTQSYLNDVFCAGINDVYVAGDQFRHWNGSTWTVIDEQPFNGSALCISYISPTNWLFTGWLSTICSYDGQVFENMEWITSTSLECFWGTYPDSIYLGGDSVVHYDGSQWYQLESPEIRAGISFDDETCYAIADYAFYFFDGQEWEFLDWPYMWGHFTDIWGTSPDDIWISGGTDLSDGGTLYHWSQSTETLEVLSSEHGERYGWSKLSGFDSESIFLIGDNKIAHYTPEGLSVEFEFTEFTYLHDVLCATSGCVYVACVDGVIMKRDGTEWSRYQFDSLRNAVSLSELNDGTIVATTKYRFFYESGDSWFPSPRNGESNYGAIGDNLNDILSYGDIGALMRFDGFNEGFEFMTWIDQAKAGKPYYIKAALYNPGEPLFDVPVVIYMDVFGELYFWPGWERYDPQNPQPIDIQYFDLTTACTVIDVIPEFTFPSVSGYSTGIQFFGAMLTSDLSAIRGDFDGMTFTVY